MSQSKIDKVRAAAVRQLLRVAEDDAYVGLGSEDQAAMDARAARQLTEYVAGVTRRRRWLDFLLAHFYHGDYDAMEPVLRQILRLGAYELLLMRTPPHAAVHEAVELARVLVRPGAAGLTNGILRAVQRSRDALPEPQTGDAADDLAIRHSHPTWMVRRWVERFGPEDTAALLAWNNRRPTYGVRVNLLKGSLEAFRKRLEALGVEAAPSLYLDDFVRVEALQPLIRAGLLDEGRCAVQDESTGLVVQLLDAQPGETVVDGCAAPGGKAVYAAARMQGRGRLWAVDVHPGRLQLVRRAARTQGLGIVRTRAADLRDFAARPDAPRADRVLVDAPCSGLGVLAKRADLRWQRTPEDLATLTALQGELLDAAARLVRPGGQLVYATCSIAPEENEARTAAFLRRHDEFRPVHAGAWLPDAVVTAKGHFASLPHIHGIDGAFAARFERGVTD